MFIMNYKNENNNGNNNGNNYNKIVGLKSFSHK